MLRTVFGTPDGKSFSPGVFSELRFDGNLLRPSAVGKPIAEQRDDSWHVEGKNFLRLDCQGLVFVYFTESNGSLGPVYGPYQHLCSVGGVMFADSRRFATFDEATGVWAIEHTELRCPVLVARAPD